LELNELYYELLVDCDFVDDERLQVEASWVMEWAFMK